MLSSRSTFFLVSVVLSLGCSDASTGGVGAEGGGGAGGATGQGGGAAGAGGGAPSCDAAVQELCATFATQLGFIGLSSTATLDVVVAGVSATELELTSSSEPSPFTFRFAGGDLTTAFSVGEAATARQRVDTAFSYVQGSGSAVVLTNNSDLSGGIDGGSWPSPLDGPTFTFSPLCTYFDPDGGCEGGDVTPKVLSATLGPAEASIVPGATAEVGGWQVWAGPSTRNVTRGCAPNESTWGEMATALKPAP